MLDKPSRRKVDIKAKYVGYEIEDKFVIGYGLDYNESYRNIPCVGVINKKESRVQLSFCARLFRF